MTIWPFLIVLGTVFAALVVVLRYVLSRNLTSASAHLQTLSADYAHRQEELKARLEESERQYQEQTARARVEAERLITEARQEADSLRNRQLEEARQESERIVQQALESRDALRQELEQTLEGRALERACELLQQALPDQLKQELQQLWMDTLLRNGLAPAARVPAEESVGEARVVSAFPLTAAQRKLLQERLRSLLSRDLALKEETDPRLVAGLTITVGSLVLDGSLACRLQQAVRRARGEA
jgi:F0F1-type ATP synthase membrane subunit b/b'